MNKATIEKKIELQRKYLAGRNWGYKIGFEKGREEERKSMKTRTGICPAGICNGGFGCQHNMKKLSNALNVLLNQSKKYKITFQSGNSRVVLDNRKLN